MCACVRVRAGGGYTVAQTLCCYDYSGDGKIVQSPVGGRREWKAERQGRSSREGGKD